jgi:hypothetical protein
MSQTSVKPVRRKGVKPHYWVALALGLTAGSAAAAPPRGAIVARSPAHLGALLPPARGSQHAPARDRGPRVATAAASSSVTARMRPVRSRPAASATALVRIIPLATRHQAAVGLSGMTVVGRVPIHPALGGPATFDARKLVRR